MFDKKEKENKNEKGHLGNNGKSIVNISMTTMSSIHSIKIFQGFQFKLISRSVAMVEPHESNDLSRSICRLSGQSMYFSPCFDRVLFVNAASGCNNYPTSPVEINYC